MSGKAKAKSEPAGPKAIENRRSRHDYEFVETFEAGIALVGSEVKSLYLGRANLTDAHCKVENGELWLHEFDIEPYKFSTAYSPPQAGKKAPHAPQGDRYVGAQSARKGPRAHPFQSLFQERTCQGGSCAGTREKAIR